MKPEAADRRYEQIVAQMLRYLQDEGTLTDINPGSVVRTLVEAFAREMREAYAGLNVIWEMTHIDSAQGSGLDEYIALLGLRRLTGQQLKTDAVFQRASRISGRVFIPAGTALRVAVPVPGAQSGASEALLVFHTESDAELQAGQDQTTVPVAMQLSPDQDAAVLLGSQFWGEQSEMTQLLPIAGIQSVKVLRAPSLRGYQESDSELRERAKGALTATGGGTAKALENALLSSGLVQAVTFREFIESPGRLDVVVQARPEDYGEVHRLVQRHKAPGIIVDVKGMEQRQLALKPLVVRPSVANLSNEERRDLTKAIKERGLTLIRGLRAGEKLVWNRLVAELLQVDGIQDVLPPVAPGETALARTTELTLDGQPASPVGGLLPSDLNASDRLVIGEDDITVEFEGEPALLVRLLCRKQGLNSVDQASLLKRLEQVLGEIPSTETALTYDLLAARLQTTPGLGVTLETVDLRFRVRDLNGAERLLKQAGQRQNLRAGDVVALDPSGPLWAPEASWGDSE